MATTKPNKLNLAINHLRPGRPVTASELAELGISKYLVVHYVRSGWLDRVARGVYQRPGETLALGPSLTVLEGRYEGLHVGGLTALDWHGVRQYVATRPVAQLYGAHAARLPAWFTSRFPAAYHRKRIFDEDPTTPVRVSRLGEGPDAPMVSEPERAWLELLSDVGVRHAVQDARELAESMYTLRAFVLNALLTRCTSVKTVRLCLQLGNHVFAPWMAKLKVNTLPTGSDAPWVAQTADGLLVLPAMSRQ